MTLTIRTLPELEAAAAAFVRELVPCAHGALLITLSGELGAGKTAFVKAAAKALGVEDAVTSPTYVIEKLYALPADALAGFARLAHIDAYRLDSADELRTIGFDELMQDARNLILLEWPERVAGALSAASARLAFVVEADGARSIAVAYG